MEQITMPKVHFPNLFSPLVLRGVELKNRIVSTAHGTTSSVQGLPTDVTAAYHEARAKGGVALIIMEAASVHESAVCNDVFLSCHRDEAIPGFSQVAEAVHRHGAKVFGQLYHPGSSMYGRVDGLRVVPVGPSNGTGETSHAAYVEMPQSLITEVIQSYGAAAARMMRASLDGIEINARNGNLPAQFLNERINHRSDLYGGSFSNRLRFLREVIEEVRSRIPDTAPLGLRISGEPFDETGLSVDEVVEACRAIAPLVDYFNVIAGSIGSYAGLSHIVPPMGLMNGYTAARAADLRKATGRPVLAAGRITRPELAERLVAEGQVDLCGMTRALIADPELPNKAMSGRADEIRECIGCNQACIGHEPLGVTVSCIQHPETGRELTIGPRSRTSAPKSVFVVGGGPAGLKAAAVAAERGHRVRLFERERQFGGQVQIATAIPGRSEFGGLTANLLREARAAGVELTSGVTVDAEFIVSERPDVVVLATGALPPPPSLDGSDEIRVLAAASVLTGEATAGSSVIIADERCDWVGMGVAEKLVREGRWVRLCVSSEGAGSTLEAFMRYRWLGILHSLGIEVLPLLRVVGIVGDAVYCEHLASRQPVVCDKADTVVLASAYRPRVDLLRQLADFSGEVRSIGDCRGPRTAEEAVYEGLVAGLAV